MPGEWRELMVQDFAEVVGGGTPSTKDGANFGSEISWITPRDLAGHSGRYVDRGERSITKKGLESSAARILPPKAVLLTTRAPVGYLAIADRELATNQGFHSLVVRDGFLPEFVYYLLLNDVERLKSYAVGSTFQELSGSTLRKMKYVIPPLPEQRAIAGILGTLDDKIELNRRMNETLEAMARALFKSWFIDFDPVHAKAEGRDTGLPPNVAALFPESFEDSELGPIPRGWRVGKLGDVAISPRRTVRPADLGSETPYIALEHMPRRSIALTEWGTARGVESGKFGFEKGEILFGKLRPYFHKVGVAPLAGVCSTDIVVLAPRTEGWYGFVLEHVSSIPFVEYSNAGSTGTRMPRTSWGEMARYPVALPTEEVAKEFSNRVCPLIDRMVLAVHESNALAFLRDTLLPKFLSGELRLKTLGPPMTGTTSASSALHVTDSEVQCQGSH